MTFSDDHQFDLSPQDQELLDRLMDVGFEIEHLKSLTDDERRRAEAITSLMGLMNDYPVEDADDALAYATLARIDRYEDERAARMSVETQPSSRRFRLPDFITVAAAFLILASVAWPVMNYVRDRSVDMTCANNQRQLGLAFSQYNTDYGVMPLARAGIGQGWVDNVNFAALLGGKYCEHGHTKCPGGRDAVAGAGYSVQNGLSDPSLHVTSAPRMIILGDQNPVIDAAREGTVISPLTVSVNHRGRGQNVLHNDGAVEWLEEPVIGGDNIWLPHGSDTLEQGVQPAAARDVFLTH